MDISMTDTRDGKMTYDEVVGSNHSIGYWIDNFCHCNVVKNCNVGLNK